MPKWISIGEVAHKYGVKEADICLWAETGAINAYFTETTLMINEKSFRKYQWLRKNFPTSEYIHTLEQLCINQSEMCKLYMEVIELQKQDIECQERKISMLEKQYAMATEQNKLRQEVIAMTSDRLSKAASGWLEKLWMKISANRSSPGIQSSEYKKTR